MSGAFELPSGSATSYDSRSIALTLISFSAGSSLLDGVR